MEEQSLNVTEHKDTISVSSKSLGCKLLKTEHSSEVSLCLHYSLVPSQLLLDNIIDKLWGKMSFWCMHS